MKHKLVMSFAMVIIAIVAAVFVMVIHELTKAIAYAIYIKIYNKKYNKNEKCPGVWKIYNYVDPIGLILAATSNGLFSKQYPFVIRSRKASCLIGLTGYFSMIVTFGVSILSYRVFFGHNIVFNDSQVAIYYIVKGIKYILEFIAYFSTTMFLVNLFPLATFDMSLVVASCSPIAYLKIRKFDLFFKLIFLIICLLGVFSMAGMFVASKCLGF